MNVDKADIVEIAETASEIMRSKNVGEITAMKMALLLAETFGKEFVDMLSLWGVMVACSMEQQQVGWR